MTTQIGINNNANNSGVDFYCCYLLRSLPKQQSFYVGSSPNPVRRLRQHNGDLARGGAYRTKKLGTRPWEMIMIVYGFPSKSAALQFEHAWQHVYQSRFLKDWAPMKSSQSQLQSQSSSQQQSQFTKNSRGIHYKIGGARLLVQTEHFKPMNLKIRMFNEEALKIWQTNKYNLPDVSHPNNIVLDLYHLHDGTVEDEKELGLINLDDVDESNRGVFEKANFNMKSLSKFYKSYNADVKSYYQKSEEILTFGELDCLLCSRTFNYIDDEAGNSSPRVAFCYHQECDFKGHLKCLYDAFPKPEGKLVPIQGQCPTCDKNLEWVVVVRNSHKLKVNLGYNKEEP